MVTLLAMTARTYMKIVLDTNIILSALVFAGSKPAAIVQMVRDGKVDLAISRFILSEINKNLMVKFDYSEILCDKLIGEILKFAEIVESRQKITIIKAKKSDNLILECAVAADAGYLVTGDKKHILPLKKIGKTKIVSAAEFLTHLMLI